MSSCANFNSIKISIDENQNHISKCYMFFSAYPTIKPLRAKNLSSQIFSYSSIAIYDPNSIIPIGLLSFEIGTDKNYTLKKTISEKR